MPQVPRPPLFSYLLFENPWPIGALCLVVALMAIFYALQYRTKTLWLTAGISLSVGGIVIATTIFVQTDREQLFDLTEQLAHCTIPPQNISTLENLFDEQVSLTVMGNTIRQGRDQLLQQVRRVDGFVEFLKYNIATISGGVDGDGIGKIRLNINTTINMANEAIFSGGDGRPINTDWLIEWHKDRQGQWRITKIAWVKYNNQDPSASLLP